MPDRAGREPDQREVILRALAEHLRPHLEMVRGQKPDESHPVQRALVNAYLSVGEEYVARCEKLLTGSQPVDQDIDKCIAVQGELGTLHGWIFAQAEFRENEAGNWFVQNEYSYERTTEILNKARASRVGAPHSAAKRTIEALELRILDRSLTWPALADKTCDCGAPKHDTHCAERVRKNVANLKKLLSRYSDH